MKKLMVIVAFAMAALASQASSFKWGAANIYDGAGASAAKYSGTAYLFATATISQADLYAALLDDPSYNYAAKAIGSLAVNNGAITSTAQAWDDAVVGQTYQLYFAIVESDKVYLSNFKNAAANAGETPATVAFGTQAPTTGASSKNLPTTTYEGAGQWAALAPEPTSGMMMLLGMGLLALRRRRA